MWESGLDPYNIYAKRAGGVNTTSKLNISSRRDWWPLLGDKDNSYQGTTHSFSDESVLVTYMNRPDVKKALHVPPGLPNWVLCSNLPYTRIYDTMKDIYQMLHGMMHIMVYNGDLDMVCNYLGDEWFVESFGLAKAGARKPWLYPDSDSTKQVGGFRKDYSGNVRLVTVTNQGKLCKCSQTLSEIINNSLTGSLIKLLVNENSCLEILLLSASVSSKM
ncbi:lysosomal protective protein-like [Aplysia californica]|uniref:Lysosomal protective protein-like n=1 Tax=Aplysia californica TaxID=6500 RepID=A0ABM0JVV5_APLCA|nr:lysosomal protective protein-like [Aplysia californica]